MSLISAVKVQIKSNGKKKPVNMAAKLQSNTLKYNPLDAHILEWIRYSRKGFQGFPVFLWILWWVSSRNHTPALAARAGDTKEPQMSVGTKWSVCVYVCACECVCVCVSETVGGTLLWSGAPFFFLLPFHHTLAPHCPDAFVLMFLTKREKNFWGMCVPTFRDTGGI